MKKGIDISVWQGKVDFEKVKAAGIEFVMIRAGFGGGNVDERFHRNVSECNRLGIPCGVYWFSYALSVKDAVEEARHCLDTILGYKIDYPVCIDFEYDSTRYATEKGTKVDKKFVTEVICAFCEDIEKAGYRAGVYTNYDYSRNMIDMNAVSKYALWYARYNDSCERADADIWQYSNQGRVDGIAGDVDLNIAFTDYTVKKDPPPAAQDSDLSVKAAEKAAAKGIFGNGGKDSKEQLDLPFSRRDMLVILELLGLLD